MNNILCEIKIADKNHPLHWFLDECNVLIDLNDDTLAVRLVDLNGIQKYKSGPNSSEIDKLRWGDVLSFFSPNNVSGITTLRKIGTSPIEDSTSLIDGITLQILPKSLASNDLFGETGDSQLMFLTNCGPHGRLFKGLLESIANNEVKFNEPYEAEDVFKLFEIFNIYGGRKPFSETTAKKLYEAMIKDELFESERIHNTDHLYARRTSDFSHMAMIYKSDYEFLEKMNAIPADFLDKIGKYENKKTEAFEYLKEIEQIYFGEDISRSKHRQFNSLKSEILGEYVDKGLFVDLFEKEDCLTIKF